MENLKKMLEHHEGMLHGTNGEVGLKSRVELIEQSEETRKFHIRTLYTVVAGFLVKTFWDLFRK